MSHPHFFCFGLGYSGSAISKNLLAKGWSVSGTCRTEPEQEHLKSRGIKAHLFEGSEFDEQILGSLEKTTHILSTVPPDEEGDPVIKVFGPHIAKMDDLLWVGYLSTTGVYGNRDGSWVYEESAARPESSRGRRRLSAEREWLSVFSDHGIPLHIFRLSAIYGPGRNSLVRIKNGKAKRINQPGLFFSRIHLDDLVQILFASMNKISPGRIYNIGDDLPAPPEEVIRFASELLNVPPPPLKTTEEAGLSELAKSFYQDSKRVSNQRIKKELGIRLEFPDYRAGLKHLLKTLDTG